MKYVTEGMSQQRGGWGSCPAPPALPRPRQRVLGSLWWLFPPSPLTAPASLLFAGFLAHLPALCPHSLIPPPRPAELDLTLAKGQPCESGHRATAAPTRTRDISLPPIYSLPNSCLFIFKISRLYKEAANGNQKLFFASKAPLKTLDSGLLGIRGRNRLGGEVDPRRLQPLLTRCNCPTFSLRPLLICTALSPRGP